LQHSYLFPDLLVFLCCTLSPSFAVRGLVALVALPIAGAKKRKIFLLMGLIILLLLPFPIEFLNAPR